MEIKSLTPKGICEIIKQCKDSGVSLFELGDLKVQFGQTNSGLMGTWPALEGTQTNTIQNGSFDAADEKQENLDTLHHRTLEDLETVQTLIDDPAQFEQDIIEGFLSETGGGENAGNETRRTTAII